MSYPATHSYRPAPRDRPTVLLIGGSDASGLAGIQMDCRYCEAMGVHPCVAVTATTAQNNQGLYSLGVTDISILEAQIDAALALQPAAIKIGLLGSVAQVEMLASKLANLNIPLILDTIVMTSSGGRVLSEAGCEALLTQLLPLATVVTPNLPEAKALLGDSPQTAAEQATALRTRGAEWVVIKGGHDQGEFASDYCHGPSHSFTLRQPRLDTPHLRGTGCAFASLIASAIALGYEIRDALTIAKMALQESLLAAGSVNGDTGCPRPKIFPARYWPQFKSTAPPTPESTLSFPACTGGDYPESLGLYPIVDSANWLEKLLPLGITTIQLRIKHLKGAELSREVQTAVAIAEHYQCRLFINDHWQLAIKYGAYGVHLGQEDIATADLSALAESGLRLGVSTHCHFEVARALSLQPSYIATGPVFATTTKDMPWVPHGLAGLSYWCRSVKGIPLVAIGGINETNIADIAASGVSGIALITAITHAEDPASATKKLMALMNNRAAPDAE